MPPPERFPLRFRPRFHPRFNALPERRFCASEGILNDFRKLVHSENISRKAVDFPQETHRPFNIFGIMPRLWDSRETIPFPAKTAEKSLNLSQKLVNFCDSAKSPKLPRRPFYSVTVSFMRFIVSAFPVTSSTSITTASISGVPALSGSNLACLPSAYLS